MLAEFEIIGNRTKISYDNTDTNSNIRVRGVINIQRVDVLSCRTSYESTSGTNSENKGDHIYVTILLRENKRIVFEFENTKKNTCYARQIVNHIEVLLRIHQDPNDKHKYIDYGNNRLQVENLCNEPLIVTD